MFRRTPTDVPGTDGEVPPDLETNSADTVALRANVQRKGTEIRVPDRKSGNSVSGTDAFFGCEAYCRCVGLGARHGGQPERAGSTQHLDYAGDAKMAPNRSGEQAMTFSPRTDAEAAEVRHPAQSDPGRHLNRADTTQPPVKLVSFRKRKTGGQGSTLHKADPNAPKAPRPYAAVSYLHEGSSGRGVHRVEHAAIVVRLQDESGNSVWKVPSFEGSGWNVYDYDTYVWQNRDRTIIVLELEHGDPQEMYDLVLDDKPDPYDLRQNSCAINAMRALRHSDSRYAESHKGWTPSTLGRNLESFVRRKIIMERRRRQPGRECFHGHQKPSCSHGQTEAVRIVGRDAGFGRR